MAIANFSLLKTKIEKPWRRVNDTKNSLTVVAGRLYSLWLQNPDAGAVPTTAVAPTSATTGAMGQPNSNTTLRLSQFDAAGPILITLTVVDRLSHQGGLSGTATTAQTTNLPTAALTRYADGVGVMAAAEIYTLIGTTTVNITASYTNQAGTAAQTSTATSIGGTGFNAVSRFITLPLAPGDTGVRQVASITNSATTGTAGAFGVTLFKPLMVIPMTLMNSTQTFNAMFDLGGSIPVIEPDACLAYLVQSWTSSSGQVMVTHTFTED